MDSPQLIKDFLIPGILAYADDLLLKFVNANQAAQIIRLVEKWASAHDLEINKNDEKSNTLFIHKHK